MIIYLSFPKNKDSIYKISSESQKSILSKESSDLEIYNQWEILKISSIESINILAEKLLDFLNYLFSKRSCLDLKFKCYIIQLKLNFFIYINIYLINY